jgi:hypothetical protein
MLRRCLNDYGKDIIGLPAEKQICLDGKKLKGVSRQAGVIQACILLIVGVGKSPVRWTTGIWMLRSEKTVVVQEKTMLLKIFLP